MNKFLDDFCKWPKMTGVMTALQQASFLENHLWKFMPLTDLPSLTWQERLAQLMIQGRAYFPSPRDFNDPFDSLPHAPAPTSLEEIHKNRHILIDRMVNSIKSVPADQIRQQMLAALEHANPKQLATTVRKSVDLTSSKIGVFCLSETIDHVLMWSHYAHNHTGFALRFDWRVQMTDGIAPLFPVKYQKERPALTDFFSASTVGDIADALCVKADFWSYEKEWRCLKPDRARTLVDFDPTCFDGIIFGARCTIETERDVRQILRDRKVDFFRAQAAIDTFELQIFGQTN